MKNFTDYAVLWNVDNHSGRIKFFAADTSSSLCTEEIGERDIFMMIDLMQTQGIQEFLIRFENLITVCQAQPQKRNAVLN